LQETAICEEQKESAPFCSRKRKKNNQLLISSAHPAGPLKKALKTRLLGTLGKCFTFPWGKKSRYIL